MILRVGAPYRVSYYNQNRNVNKGNKSSGIQKNTVNFSGQKVIESLIIEDLNNFNIKNYNRSAFSKKLNEIVSHLETLRIDDGNNNQLFIIKAPENKVIRIQTNDKYKDVKPGCIVGKAGVYATLEIPDPKGNYVIIIPEDAKLKTEDGLFAKVTGANSSSLSFKGSTCTVNAFYKPDKTIESVKSFVKMIQSSDMFKNVDKSMADYSKDFHPYLLAGGFGSRLEALSYYRNDNKPSTSTPVKNWNLVDFSLLNLYQANLLNKDTDIDFCVQTEANSAVGCFITTLGQKIEMTPDGLDLVKDGKSIVPEGKNIIIMPSDNITDIKLSKALDAFRNTPDAGMLVVGVPDYRCYGGLILHNDKNEITDFITKPTKDLLDTGIGLIKYKDSDGKEKVLKDGDGMSTSLGNAFIYILNPDILDTITEIYRNKIRTSYANLMEKKRGSKELSKEEYLDVIECFWDREIIPTLVDMSKKGCLKNKEGKDLKVVTYKATDASWSDVGEYSSYYKTMKNVAKDDSFVNMPEIIKNNVKDNISDNVIFNADVKDSFKKFIGNGYVEGKVIVVPKDR